MRIMEKLQGGRDEAKNVTKLSKELGLPRSVIIARIRVLKGRGLIQGVGQHGVKRPAYTLTLKGRTEMERSKKP